MNKYQKKVLMKHRRLYENGCYETIDIICPKARPALDRASDAWKSWSTHRHYFTDYIHATYNCGWYPRIKAPSLWKRISAPFFKKIKHL